MNSRPEPDSAAPALSSDPLASRDSTSSPLAKPGAAVGASSKEETPIWLRRVSLVVFVLCCLEIGLLLVALPWTTIWTENSLLVGNPRLQTFVRQNFVRGLVSGLGLLDIWLGIWEALHYRERAK